MNIEMILKLQNYQVLTRRGINGIEDVTATEIELNDDLIRPIVAKVAAVDRYRGKTILKLQNTIPTKTTWLDNPVDELVRRTRNKNNFKRNFS